MNGNSDLKNIEKQALGNTLMLAQHHIALLVSEAFRGDLGVYLGGVRYPQFPSHLP